MDEKHLIVAARKGELAAFSELVRRHQAKVRAALAVRMQRVHDAEDLAQEAFVIAYRKLPEFDIEREFGPWVRSIAFNLLKNYWRKHRDEPAGGTTELEVLINRQLETRNTERDESVKLSALRYCMTKLSADFKTLLHKHYVKGMSVGELTRESGLKHSAMTMRLHRMRDQLRRCISEQTTFWRVQ
ncbi:MAG: sigma-70 family RNA polymerase sigma factor [Kiritimatiellia bacterium]